MKKTVIVNGKAKRIEFSYAVGETISLSNTEVKKPWGRVTERVTVSKLTFTINGKTYEGTRTFKVAGGPYSETFEFDGKIALLPINKQLNTYLTILRNERNDNLQRRI